VVVDLSLYEGREREALRLAVRRGGGTGRRIGLKIRRAQKARVGSIPTPGTFNSTSCG
jgi:hypothetical protein